MKSTRAMTKFSKKTTAEFSLENPSRTQKQIQIHRNLKDHIQMHIQSHVKKTFVASLRFKSPLINSKKTDYQLKIRQMHQQRQKKTNN